MFFNLEEWVIGYFKVFDILNSLEVFILFVLY